VRFRTPIRRLVSSAFILAATACASSSNGATGTGGSGGSTNPNVLSGAEIASSSWSQASIYEAVQRLRPTYLQSRGRAGNVPGAGDILASIDGGPLNPVETLRSLNAGQVREVRYLSASDAAQRFGVRANSGAVILVLQK